jgi:hypothetical protein
MMLAARLRALAIAGRLGLRGDLLHLRHSQVRLPRGLAQGQN